MQPRTITLTFPSARARWIGYGLAIGLLAAAIAGPALGPRSTLAVDSASTPEHTITVTGTGRVVVSPDVADIRLGVIATKPTVNAARATAAASMSKVIAALKKIGIADKDIQTTGLSLQPNYAYSNNSNPRLTGYTLSNGVAVTIRDLDKIGDAIDGALAAGATTLDGVTFRVDDPVKAQQRAREQAMAEAKSRAQTLASSAGVSISGVASISETTGPVPYPVYYEGARYAAVAKDTATPVETGTNEVMVVVSVVYLID